MCDECDHIIRRWLYSDALKGHMASTILDLTKAVDNDRLLDVLLQPKLHVAFG